MANRTQLPTDPTKPLFGTSTPGWEKFGVYYTPGGGIDLRDKSGTSVLGLGGAIVSGGSIGGAFGAQENGIPSAVPNYADHPNAAFRAVGGGQGDALKFYVLTEANYLAHQTTLAAYVNGLAAALTLTIGANGAAAAGTIADIPATSFVVIMRVGASVDAPIFLQQTA